ncbi:asparagine synthase (glutamine-hydrolyzing) [Variovorax sp. LT1R20]|uniref:asparagine synthase (glutamine-hydrolyzing) n=1 Tax=Variovorax sp. LT1R20 TaxID=3443729 RepID=UPI003F4878F4
MGDFFMCGIFGFLNRQQSDSRTLEERISLGLNAIRLRGPDGQGVQRDSINGFDVVLAHTRLSIIDLSMHGSQPMHDEASNWSITYNGEIYNYLEIRKELQELGWKFDGQSDTEVLLKGWAEWGVDVLPRLNGMFAFAIFNKNSGDLWLARDRFGVKPLLWANMPGEGVVFSSSIAAVAKLAETSVDISYCARGLRYKAFEVADSGAPFVGVHSIPAGGWLRIKPTAMGLDMSDGRWYDLKAAVSKLSSHIESYSDEALLDECQRLLHDSVTLRLRSDVPLAVSLSGGLDSSSISALAGRQIQDLRGFTYGSPDAPLSEGPLVADFSKKVGVVAQYVWPTHDARALDQLLQRTLEFQEAPFGGLSVLAQNEVFREVRQAGFKVLLGGQGGDEVFAGYRKFFIVATRHAWKRREFGDALRLVYSLGQMLMHEVSQAGIYWTALTRYTNKQPGFKLMDWGAEPINLWGSPGGTLAQRQIDDIQNWSIPSLLRFEDRNSMGNGLETRLPFMDYRLVELGLALPARLKISKGFGKWGLRHITAGVVPDTVRLNRKKRGFDVTQDWIKSGIGASLRDRVHSHLGTLRPYLKRDVDLDKSLSDATLSSDRNALDEALMLAWLAEPIRFPTNPMVSA